MSWEEVTIGACRLIRGDAREFAGMLDADVLLTDPPYGLPGGARHGLYQKPNHAWTNPPYIKSNTIFHGKENTSVGSRVLRAYLGQVQWAVIWGGQGYVLLPSHAWLVWNKHTTGQLGDCELAWTNLPYDSVRQFSYLWNGYQKQHPEKRWHPTQKPLALGTWCLDQIPGDIVHVLDPYAGSFVFAEASVKRGLSCTAIEIDPHYFDLGCRRIEAAYAQPDMFVPQPTPPQQLTLA
jgi:site-specific DNA-methyltransferase (adenine-specific)